MYIWIKGNNQTSWIRLEHLNLRDFRQIIGFYGGGVGICDGEMSSCDNEQVLFSLIWELVSIRQVN